MLFRNVTFVTCVNIITDQKEDKDTSIQEVKKI